MDISAPRQVRPYQMRRRAQTAADTGRRILEATLALHLERFHDQITLESIAERAGVTVQTVLRRFGTKERLLDEAADYATSQVSAQRGQAPAGDVPGAVENLLDHYGVWGKSALRLLAQEDRVPQFRRVTERGRAIHADWVRRAFAPFLEARAGNRLLEAELIALTDVYVWKLLQIDLGLDRGATAAALTHMLTAVMSPETAS